MKKKINKLISFVTIPTIAMIVSPLISCGCNKPKDENIVIETKELLLDGECYLLSKPFDAEPEKEYTFTFDYSTMRWDEAREGSQEPEQSFYITFETLVGSWTEQPDCPVDKSTTPTLNIDDNDVKFDGFREDTIWPDKENTFISPYGEGYINYSAFVISYTNISKTSKIVLKTKFEKSVESVYCLLCPYELT